MQEHWLFSFEEHLFNDLLQGCNFATKYADDTDPIQQTHKPRGQSGIAIIWKTESNYAINTLNDGGNRVQAVQVSTTSGLMTLINTYLPSNGSHAKSTTYAEVLDEVNEIYEKYCGHSIIMWAGDLNGSLIRKHPSSNDKLLKEFCSEK